MATAVSTNVITNNVNFDGLAANLEWNGWIADNPPSGTSFGVSAPAGTFTLSASVTFTCASALPATNPVLNLVRSSDGAIISSVTIPLVAFPATVVVDISGSDVSATGDVYYLSTRTPVAEGAGAYTYEDPATFTGDWTAAPPVPSGNPAGFGEFGVPSGGGGNPPVAPATQNNPGPPKAEAIFFIRQGTLNWHRGLTYGQKAWYTGLNKGQGAGFSWVGSFPWFLPPGVR